MGWPTVFVRLTGCPLRCSYCDTSYAFTGGKLNSLDEILSQVQTFGVRHVCVTGGEPLAQANCINLLKLLADAGYEVSLETSGALDISAVDARITKVIDLKTPSSLESGKNRYENLQFLNPNDQIKFVIMNEADYLWAKEQVRVHQLASHWEVLFSPAAGSISPRILADKIIEDRLPVRFQLQLHKILWDDARGK